MLRHNQYTDKHNKRIFTSENKYTLQYKHIRTKVLIITNLILILTILIQIMKLDAEMESLSHTLINLKSKLTMNKE